MNVTTRVRRFVAAHQLLAFFLVAYAFTWTLQAPLLLFGMEMSWTAWGLVTLGALGPLVAALVVRWADGGIRSWLVQVLKWRLHPAWYLAVVALPVVFLALGSALYAAMGYELDPTTLTQSGLGFYGLLLGLILFEAVIGGGKEELGWRGFALPKLQERYTALGATLILGTLWAGWHLLQFFTPASPHSAWPLGQQLLWGFSLVGFSVVLTWAFNTTGSAWLAMLMHGGWNVLSTLVPMDPGLIEVGGTVYADARVAATGAVAAAVWLVALALIAVYGPERLARGPVAVLDHDGEPAVDDRSASPEATPSRSD